MSQEIAMSVKEYADLKEVSVQNVYYLINNNRIKYKKIGKGYVVLVGK